MRSTRFHKTGIKPFKTTQGFKRRTRPRLTREARKAITLRRRQNAVNYQESLDKAWEKINEVSREIAANHSKSVRHVQQELHMRSSIAPTKKTNAWNAFCWKKAQEKENDPNACSLTGKELLKYLVSKHQGEYEQLTVEERKSLVKELEEEKAMRAKSRRVSMKSRVSDVSLTIATMGDALHNLRSRTGVESMLFVSQGSTDMPLHAITFATEGVENFLEQVMKIDTQSFVGRMEGYAIQGIKGAVQNHQQRVLDIRSQVREEILQGLRLITANENIHMEWKHYAKNIVQRHRVIIEGWPTSIPFRNLSEASSSLTELQSLLEKWRNKTTYWKQLSEAELEEWQATYDQQIKDGYIEAPPPRRQRSDYGRKHKLASHDSSKKRGKRRAQDDDDSSSSTSSEDDDSRPTRTKGKRKNKKKTSSDSNATSQVTHQDAAMAS